MKRTLAGGVFGLVLLTWSLFSGCALVPKPDDPPPLPKVEEPKPTPPLTLKGDHFKAFPWDELPKMRKEGTDPDTTVYVCRSDESLDKVAEEQMGDRTLAGGLARFNELADPKGVKEGEKLIIPFPIIGVSSQMVVKGKDDKDFGQPQPIGYKLAKGDQYKLRFETNVNGYLYVYRTGMKGTTQLFPAPSAPAKPAPRGKKPTRPQPEPPAEPKDKVMAHQPVLIPSAGKPGKAFDPNAVVDRIHVFFSMREIPALESLRRAKKIEKSDLELKDEINEGKIVESLPVRVIRVENPKEILGFTISNVSG
jgi:hypothetical protein